jgi:hypothetical protein
VRKRGVVGGGRGGGNGGDGGREQDSKTGPNETEQKREDV